MGVGSVVKVAALTSGRNVPSARFRIRQHLSYLGAAGIEVKEYCPPVSQGARLPGSLGSVRLRYLPPLLVGQLFANAAMRVPGVIGSRAADVTWLERNFIPGLDDLAFVLKRPLIVDIDDAIWLYNPFGSEMIRRLVRRADVVFAGNRFIAEWCSDFCKNIEIIPTAVDAKRYSPKTGDHENDSFVIGWIGTSGNFRFLKMIEPALSLFLSKAPNAKLLVVAEQVPELHSVPNSQMQFVRWSPDRELFALQSMDVGIMPLDDSDLSRGKCSFKMLQYMSLGIPVVGSPYGMNSELFAMGGFGYPARELNEWVNALEVYVSNSSLRRVHGAAGRRIVESEFAQEIVGQKILRAIHRIAS